jgi:hypothetical protein
VDAAKHWAVEGRQVKCLSDRTWAKDDEDSEPTLSPKAGDEDGAPGKVFAVTAEFDQVQAVTHWAVD